MSRPSGEGAGRRSEYQRPSPARGWALIAALFATLAVLATPADAAAGTTVTATPITGLTSGQSITISVTGAPPGSTLLAVECSASALSIGEDGCENHRDAVFFANATGGATTTLDVTSQISTATGEASCVTSTCLLGVVRFTSPTTDTIIGATGLSFTSTACSGGTACEDAPPIPTTVISATRRVTSTEGSRLITPSKPFDGEVLATRAGDLTTSSAITGPYAPFGGRGPGTTARRRVGRGATYPGARGVGLVQLSMDGPGTAWASRTDKAVTASVRVDRGPWQSIVLFAGSQPFTYAGFTGPLNVGLHEVSIRIDLRRSTTGDHVPAAALYRIRLRVLTPDNPMYLIEKYAPVIYGRSTSASSDTQLLTYADATTLGGGSTALSYETVWSHEDAGTSFVPFLESGEWGRMTDITGTARLEVSSTGVISNTTYNSCGCAPPFPEGRTSLAEVRVPFTGRYFDQTHMVLRNASGNDYQSVVNATDFRFQQPAVVGPPAGEPREAIMDIHPWTYRIMADEVRYWYLDRSTNPMSGQPGASRQYAIISLDTSSTASTVGVALRLAGSSTWYRSDMGSGAPLYGGGLGRTVVKLPPGWESRRITGVQLDVYPASATGSMRIHSFKVLGLTPGFRVVQIHTPAPTVVPGEIDVPSQG